VAENINNLNLQKSSSILITGGSGLIGRYLTSALLGEGHKVSHLSRKANQFGKVRVFRWDPEKKIIDPVVFDGIDCIIHLAGANIGEKRWTSARKKEIIKSRVESAHFLHKTITGNGIRINTFISASAIGYYGSVTSDKIFTEDDEPGEDFFGNTCRQWEEAADLFGGSGIRTVKIRNAVVMEESDSALARLMLPAKFGFVVRTGSGSQYMPWIHISDLCKIYLKAVNDHNMTGAFNAVSPQHVTHDEFIRVMAKVMNRPLFLPPVPAFLLRALLGEMSQVVLNGSRISCEKLIKSGFSFDYPDLEQALKNVISG